MNGSYLLDTNIVIALFANDPDVLQQLSTAPQVFVPAVVLGELYYGANKSAHSKSNLALIDSFALKSTVLGCDIDHCQTLDHLRRANQFRKTISGLPPLPSSTA